MRLCLYIENTYKFLIIIVTSYHCFHPLFTWLLSISILFILFYINFVKSKNM